MTKWQKVKRFVHDVIIGALVTAFIAMTIINFSGNIAIKEQLDLMQHTDVILSNKIKSVRKALSGTKLSSKAVNERLEGITRELDAHLSHEHTLHKDYKKTLASLKELIKIIRENGEYCVRKGDITCAQ